MEITPHTKMGPLLDEHPELVEVLVEAVPAFIKLKNPVLRATVAKFATLEHASRVSGMPLPELIGLIRRSLGQEAGGFVEGAASSVLEAWPAWYLPKSVVVELNANQILAQGTHPFAQVKQHLNTHPPGSIVVLESDFEPAPLLAKAQEEGWLSACVRKGDTYRTALRRP